MFAYTTEDVLVWAVRKAINTLDWVPDSLSGNGTDTEGPEFDALDTARMDLIAAAKLVDHYSDGRPIESRIDIEDGVFTTHVWPYRATNLGEQLLYTNRRSADPGEDHGAYSVFANESTCTLRVELHEPRPRHLRRV
ncbi:hypothetical protein [Rhodococcus sp. SORGH_AS_0303]|uniref:hypothetical protein n=1 Tax=Rhodococcus sp. SORGH_AS_0303 TaxID=3041753 RepID=UPI002782756D|nr:hypothetical protein [Rhodococcus sp. SORGH_AS_0303]MDQ1201081.1 hypothetical protein [Rhodococcus sp. SORGH_AS_0303]